MQSLPIVILKGAYEGTSLYKRCLPRACGERARFNMESSNIFWSVQTAISLLGRGARDRGARAGTWYAEAFLPALQTGPSHLGSNPKLMAVQTGLSHLGSNSKLMAQVDGPDSQGRVASVPCNCVFSLSLHGTHVPEEWGSRWGLCRLFAYVGCKISTHCLCRHLWLCSDTPPGTSILVDYCQWPLHAPPGCGKCLLGRWGMNGFSTSLGGEMRWSCHHRRSRSFEELLSRRQQWLHRDNPPGDLNTAVSHSPVFSPAMGAPRPVLPCGGAGRVSQPVR